MIHYHIGQVSKIVGFSVKTIRFYEDQGLLDSPLRAKNGYRLYPSTAIKELQLLKQARDLGLPIAQIKKLMRGCEHGDCQHTKKYLTTSITNFKKELTVKIKQMNKLRSKLNVLNNLLKDNPHNTYCCDILHQLLNISKQKGGDKK